MAEFADPRKLGTPELRKYIRRLMDALYRARKELSEREGDCPKGVSVDFSSYVSD